MTGRQILTSSVKHVSNQRSIPAATWNSYRQPSEWNEPVLVNLLDLHHTLLDSGERQYKSRTCNTRFDATLRADGTTRHNPLTANGCDVKFARVTYTLNSHGARPVHLVITMITWIRTSRLSVKSSHGASLNDLPPCPDGERHSRTSAVRMLSADRSHTHRQQVRCKATWKREFTLPWREAGPPSHHDDNVDSDQ